MQVLLEVQGLTLYYNVVNEISAIFIYYYFFEPSLFICFFSSCTEMCLYCDPCSLILNLSLYMEKSTMSNINIMSFIYIYGIIF